LKKHIKLSGGFILLSGDFCRKQLAAGNSFAQEPTFTTDSTDNTDLHGSKKVQLGPFLSLDIRVIRVHPW
jgi:hypothetical protein